MKYLIQLISLVILLTVSSSVMANTMCAISDIKLDYIQLAYDPLTPVGDIPDAIPLPGAINSSDCVLLLGNDQPLPHKDTGGNIGLYQDGLLNGGVWKNSPDPLLNPANTLFDPFYVGNGHDVNNDGFNDKLKFITPLDLQDLDKDGNFNDPGWVFLGKDDGKGADFEYAHTGVGIVEDIIGGELEGLDIGNLIDITFSCSADRDTVTLLGSDGDCTSGWWSIMPDYDIADQLEGLFGEGFFDHLAFVVKTGNICHPDPENEAKCLVINEFCEEETNPGQGKGPEKEKKCKDRGPEFAIYDFNFNDIFSENPDALQYPHNLGGTFDLGSSFHGSGISHISVWARDPALTTDITEPKATMLMLFALGLLVFRFKSTRAI